MKINGKTVFIKGVVFAIFIIVLNVIANMLIQAYEPTVASDIALEVAKGTPGAWENQRMYEAIQSYIYNGRFLVFFLLGICLFFKEIRFLFSKLPLNKVSMLLLVMVVITLAGCVKPYKKEAYVDVKSYQTAFVIPLEDSGNKQVKVNSIDWYEQKKVFMKRIPITKRWHQIGYRSWDGKWIATVRVILVDRTAINRSWTAESTRGTSDRSEAIWLESKDSIGFSLPFNVTANILENDTARFLYWYPADDGRPNLAMGSSFSHDMAYILDNEVRNKVQEVATEICAKYDLNELREKKNEVTIKVKEVVIPYFKNRGINITTIGIAGDITYRNPLIQEAIDNVFIAQQQEPKESALFGAMENMKERKKRDGIAEANKKREEARGIKQSLLEKGKGSKDAISKVAKALELAKNNPLYVEWKRLEVRKASIKKWGETGGRFPERVPSDLKEFLPLENK